MTFWRWDVTSLFSSAEKLERRIKSDVAARINSSAIKVLTMIRIVRWYSVIRRSVYVQSAYGQAQKSLSYYLKLAKPEIKTFLFHT